MRGGETTASTVSSSAAGFKSMRRRLPPNLRLVAWPALRAGIDGSARRGGQGVTDLLRGGSLGFPQTRFAGGGARSAIQLAVRHRGALALGAAAVIGLGGAAYLAVGYVQYARLTAA